MGKKKNLFKQYWWLLIPIIMIPCIINFIMIQPRVYDITGNDTSWLSFWGGYIGSIISALIAMFILWKQLNQNHEENKKNRELQLAILKHGQEKARLFELRKAFVDFRSSFDYDKINEIINNMINGNYEQNDNNSLSSLMHDIDEKNFIVETLLPEIKNEEFIRRYFYDYNVLYARYTLYIKDLSLFYILIMNSIGDNKWDVEKWLEIINEGDSICNSKPEKISGFDPPKSIVSIVKETGDYENIEKNVPEILRKFVSEHFSDYTLSVKLKQFFLDFIKSEEKRIDDELYNKLGSTPKENSETSK